MNLADVMDEVAGVLDNIEGLRVHAFPADKVTPDAAVVTYPESYEFDATYGRGTDRMTLPVVVLVGRVTDRKARDRIGQYADGSGVKSVKEWIEKFNPSNPFPLNWNSFDTARVTTVEFDIIRVAEVDHLTAEFSLDIVGKGAT